MTEKIVNYPNVCTEIIWTALKNITEIHSALRITLVKDLKKYIKDFKLERAIEEYQTVEEKFYYLEDEGVLNELHDCYIDYINKFFDRATDTSDRYCSAFLSKILDDFLDEVDFTWLVKKELEGYLEDFYRHDLGKRSD